MTQFWHASIQGMPWNEEKMNQAVQHLRRRATVHFRVGVDTYEDLTELDMNVFAVRPDLILHISNADLKAKYTSIFLGRLAQLKHVSALQLDCSQVQDLTILGALKQLVFLRLNSTAKATDLSFIEYYRDLTYLELHGKFKNLISIEKCKSLETLTLNCSVDCLEFLTELPKLQYLSLDQCELKCELDVLAQSTIRMLKLSSVRKLMSIKGLEQMHGLEYLHVSLSKLEQLCDFSQLPRLRQLELVYMKSLQDIEGLWTASALEVLELKEINTALKATSFARLAELKQLRQVDFRFIDFNKGRIAAMREQLIQQEKSHVIYEHIPEQQRIQSMAIEHISRYLT
ncbi:hypothetical protein [Paenibacillus sp. TSA_86.1]|uniref:hypothetical protein n=1 Tax=Paenibacillus sp. TSA_86.1 TaxID=3415649 RepID=UPI004045FB67